MSDHDVAHEAQRYFRNEEAHIRASSDHQVLHDLEKKHARLVAL